MPYMTTPDGIRLYYEELGQGEPLLLINGQGGEPRCERVFGTTSTFMKFCIAITKDIFLKR